MKILRNIILVFSIFCYSSLQAEIVKNIVIEGNKITQSGFTREIFETEGPAKALIEKQLQILQHVNS